MLLTILAEIGSKFLRLGGVFYGALVVLILVVIAFPQRRWIVRQVLVGSLVGAFLIVSMSQIVRMLGDLPKDFNALILSENEKIKRGTFTVKPMLSQMRQSIPETGLGCYVSTWDIPDRYALQLLYPHQVKLIFRETPDLEECEYVISQFSPVEMKGLFLIDKIVVDGQVTYLYRSEK